LFGKTNIGREARVAFAAWLLLASAFLFGGIVKPFDFAGATAEVRALDV